MTLKKKQEEICFFVHFSAILNLTTGSSRRLFVKNRGAKIVMEPFSETEVLGKPYSL
jgi:hypothetical protein